jgi:trehalose/maltose transport system substrate-binding protein
MRGTSVAAATLAMLVALAGPVAGQTTVAISCGSVGVEFALCREGAEDWARRTGNRVRMVSTPSGASERLALYQQLLAARSPDIDVLQIDVVWPGILANHLTDLSGHFDEATRGRHFAAIVENNTVAGRLAAMPWFTDAGLLYYRKDLLEKHGHRVPETWAEMVKTADAVMNAEREAGNSRMWGYVFQGRAYEGLTVNALEWLVSHGGGAILAPDGTVTVDNPQAAEALGQAASWVGTIAPPGVLNYAEEEARGVFQSGNAVFMRNWPYAWPLVNAADSPVRDAVEVVRLPRGGGPEGTYAAVLGGWQLAVSCYSRSPEAAIDLVQHLTGVAEQKRRAIEGGFNPTIKELYQDPEVLAANPFFRGLHDTLIRAVARPSVVTGVRYNQVSTEFSNAVHDVLSGRSEAGPALRRLERTLERISRGGQWLSRNDRRRCGP